MRQLAETSMHSLALGAQGSAVKALQERLLQLGYDPGEADGHYGYLTQDAVTDFQRDFGLRVDGVAGPRVLGLLQQTALPGKRQSYVLKPGEGLSGAARHFGVTTEALRYMNRLPPRATGYPGQRLVCRGHYCLAALGPDERSLRTVERIVALFTGMALPLAQVTAGRIEWRDLPPQAADLRQRTGLDLWISVLPSGRITGENVVHTDIALLLNRKRLRRLAAHELAQQSAALRAGIWLDFGRVRWGDGPGLFGLVATLREEMLPQGRPLMVTLPLPEGDTRWRWWLTDTDYAGLARLADRVVLGSHVPSTFGSMAMYIRRLEALLSLAPSWRALLGLGLRAEERDPRGELLSEMPYPKAVTTAYLAGVRPKWDTTRRMLRAPLPARPPTPEGVLWLPGRDAVAERLALLHRYNLAGVAFWPVGEEDPRVWDMVPKRILPEHFGT